MGRMRYYAQYNDSGKLIAIGTGNGGVEITEAEYNALLTEIREKAALVDKLYNGEITITSNENVTLTDAFPVRSQAPKAFFWFEKGLNSGDKTHTKYRPLALIGARKDGGSGSDTKGAYVGAYVQTSSGSNSYSAVKLSATGIFNVNSATTSENHDIMRGNYNTGTLYFGVKSDRYGFIEGRTYVWGVMPWDE